MKDKQANTWGTIGIISLIVGIVSWFAAGIWFSLISRFSVVIIGFIGIRKRQRLCLTGMLFGGLGHPQTPLHKPQSKAVNKFSVGIGVKS